MHGNQGEASVVFMNVINLTSDQQLQDAFNLLSCTFHGVDEEIDPFQEEMASYGIYIDDELVGCTVVSTNPIKAWANDSESERINEFRPNAHIAATAVKMAYKGRGIARAIRKHVLNIHARVTTCTGPSSDTLMQGFNVRSGFKKIIDRPQNTTWFYEGLKPDVG